MSLASSEIDDMHQMLLVVNVPNNSNKNNNNNNADVSEELLHTYNIPLVQMDSSLKSELDNKNKDKRAINSTVDFIINQI